MSKFENPFIEEEEETSPWQANQPSHSSYGTPAFQLPIGKTQREIELDQRERILEMREQRLAQQEKDVGKYNPPNFPPCRPIVYHDIQNDIPEQGRWLVQRFYLGWMIASLTFILNVAGAIALMASQAESAGTTFGIALIIMLIGIPVSFAFWYRAIYEGIKHDRSVSFFIFYFSYGFHLAGMAILSIGLPGWGGAGIIYAITMLSSEKIGAGVVCLIVFVSFVVQVLYGLWHIKLANAYYRSKGMTAEEAKQQALVGFSKSSAGQAIAKEAIKSTVA